MNVLLLGNGFDLQYHLPTKYNNFLHTVEYLINNTLIEPLTVGDVFSAETLIEKDPFIEECYNANKSLFDSATLDIKKINELIELTKDNIWFKYLLESFNKDVGWIDFEREIATVINALHEFLNKTNVKFDENHISESPLNRHIVKKFNYFHTQTKPSENKMGVISLAQYKINDEFVLEYPLGSNIKKVNIEKIIKTLADELYNFAKALKYYLYYFVENTFDITSAAQYLEKYKVFLHNDYIVTLNYTNTFEKIYFDDGDVFHLHGNVNDKIVLGVNPDASDKAETVDTSFLAFKKYYQRTMLDTDTEYIKWLTERYDGAEPDVHILVMGHSLDVTDEDIIRDLFGLASKITILYHSKDAKSSYITNLVNIYGKAGFDELREGRALTFLPMSMDFSKFEEQQLGNSYNNYQKQIEDAL